MNLLEAKAKDNQFSFEFKLIEKKNHSLRVLLFSESRSLQCATTAVAILTVDITMAITMDIIMAFIITGADAAAMEDATDTSAAKLETFYTGHLHICSEYQD